MATTNFELYKQYALRVLAPVDEVIETDEEFAAVHAYANEIRLQVGIDEDNLGEQEYWTALEALEEKDRTRLMLLWWLPVIEAWQELTGISSPTLERPE